MQRYIFQPLESSQPLTSAELDQEKPLFKKSSSEKKIPLPKEDPFMLLTTSHQPRHLFTQQDIDQSYQTGYIQGKSISLKELQEEAAFQEVESLKMIADYFPQLIEQNQENCRLFYQNILEIVKKILAKLLPEEEIEKSYLGILRVFQTVIDPLCQQEQLSISLHPLIQQKVEKPIRKIFEERGATLPLQFLPREDLSVSECQIRWPEGSLLIDQEKLENSLQQLLTLEALEEDLPKITLENEISDQQTETNPATEETILRQHDQQN